MKRDMELIRELLIIIESQEDDRKELILPSTMDRNKVVYHLKILEQANYVTNKIHYADNLPMWIYSSITWGTVKNF